LFAEKRSAHTAAEIFGNEVEEGNEMRPSGVLAKIHSSRGRSAITVFTIFQFCCANFGYAQQIVIDGKTLTTLSYPQSNVTDVRTGTIRGSNAFNSFSIFNVNQGNVVNMHLPGGTTSLLNLVHDQSSTINGILNSIQNGKIGGNVYFANPHGIIVGAQGAINVGALTAITPTKGFMDSFFDSPGNPSLSATTMLLNGTAPIDPNGLISIQGKVNATGAITLSSGSIENAGVITSGAVFSGNTVGFSDLVNTNGLESGSEISIRNGTIEILAARDVINAGAIVTDGSAMKNAGEIKIKAGNDVTLNDVSVLSARGHGENSSGGRITVFADRNAEMKGSALIDVRGGDISGDGGFIDLSAKEKVILEGGFFKTSADAGTAGKLLIDPDELIIGSNQRTDDGQTAAFVNFSDGGNVELTADESITVNPNVIISTRKIDHILPDTAENHLTAASKGHSGNIALTAPQITINSGAMLLAHAINEKDSNGQDLTNHKAGDITLTATDTATSVTPLVHIKNSTAKIKLDGAILKGKDVKLTATAESAKLFDDSNEATEIALGLFEGLVTPGGAAISNSTAEITLGTGTHIDAANLTLDAKAKSEAKLETSGMLLSVAYGESNPTAKVIVNDGVTLNTANDLKISSTAESTLDIKAKPFLLGLKKPEFSPDVTVAVGLSNIEATSQIDSGASLAAGGNMDVKAKMTKSHNVSASAGAYEEGSVGAAVAVSTSTSNVNAAVEGTVTVGKNLAVIADSETTKNSASAKAAVGGLTTPMKIVHGATPLYNKVTGWFSDKKPATDARSGNTSSLALSAAVTYSEHTNNATARIGEPAVSYNPAHSTSVTSQTGDAEVASSIKDAFTTKASSSIDSDLIGDKNPKGNTKENSVSAAVAIGRFTNNATALIGKNAVVNAKKAVSVNAATRIPYDLSSIDWDKLNGIQDIIDNNVAGALGEIVTSWAQSGAKGTKTAIAGAVNDLSVTNASNAFIDENAQVHLDNAFVPDLAFNAIRGNGRIDFETPHNLNTGDKVIYSAGTSPTFQGLQAGKIYYVIADGPTSIRLAESKELATAQNPQAIALLPQSAAAGVIHSFNFNQAVAVTATNEVDAVNLSGNFKIFPVPGPGTGSGETGMGGAYLGVRYNSTTEARINTGASVQADSVDVNASSYSRNISIAESGGSSGKYGINGTFSLLTISNTTVAQIDDGAIVDVRSGSIDENGNGLIDAGETASTLVKATDTSKIFNISGGITKGGSVGVGVSVSINEITRDTEALIGYRENETDESTGHLNTDGNAKVSAANDGVISSWSLAAAMATQDLKKYDWPEDGVNPQSPKGKEKLAAFLDFKMKNPKPQYGLGISGDVSVNLVSDTAKAYIKDAEIGKAEGLTVNAANNSEIDAVAGSATFTKADGTSVGLAGSVTWNEITNTTKSYVDHSTLGVTDDLSLTADSTGTIRTIAASGSGAVSRKSDSAIGFAGSLAYSYLDNDTAAYINNSDVSNATKIADGISISAIDHSTIWSIAGAGSYGGKAGIGASIAVNRMENTTEAYATNSDMESTGNLQISAEEESEIKSVSAALGIAKNGMAAAASASGNDLSNTTRAYISGKKTDGTIAGNNISLSANDEADILSIAGNLAVGKEAGFGVSASVTVTDNTVEAYIGNGSTVTAKGLGDSIAVYTGEKDSEGNKLTEEMNGLAVAATSFEDIQTFAVGGSGAGKVGVAGSATVTDLNEKTYGRIDAGATVNDADNGSASQGVLIRASDRTGILAVAGAGALGGKAGIGAGADVGIITKDTQAGITGITASGQTPATVKAKGNIIVDADSAEDVNSVAAAIGAGGSAGIAGSASVYDMELTTGATIGDGAKVSADGTVVVSAHDGTEMDMIAGNGAFGGTAGVGASAAVQVINKTVTAGIGKNAEVTGLGTGDGIQVADGSFAVAFGANSSSEGEVSAPASNDSGSDSQALSGERTATLNTKTVKGVAVTATSQDDIESITASGAIAGSFAMTLAGNVNAITTTTSASIGTGAKVNENLGSAAADQSVLVAAGNDYYHMGVAGSASGAGAVGFGVGADVTVAELKTTASVGDDAVVKAKKDVEVLAKAREEVLSISASLGAAGTVGVSGSVSVLSLNNTTSAGTGARSTVDAGGNVRIAAGDDTETDMIAGTLAIGLGGAGVGGGVGVTTITKETTATVGSDSSVTARGNATGLMTVYSVDTSDGTETIKGLSVEASSTEDVFTVAAAGAGGLIVGLAGAVAVETVDSNTRAAIGTNASINKDVTDGNIDQDVNVGARNSVRTNVIAGSLAGGAVGLAGGVDVGSIKNDTSASIGSGAQVYARRDVDVNSISKTEIDSVVVSAAGGIGAIAGGVAVYSVGSGVDQDSKERLQKDKIDVAKLSGDADGQASDNSIDSLLAGSSDSRITSISASAQAKRAGVSTSTQVANSAPSGTAAFIDGARVQDDVTMAGAKVQAGRNIDVNARVNSDVDILTGAASGGAVGLGAGVAVLNVSGANQAYIGSASQLKAVGNLDVTAYGTSDTALKSYVGSGGIVAANAAVAISNDDTLTAAYAGDDVVIDKALDVKIEATSDDTADARTFSASIGGAAAGVSYAEADLGRTVRASVGTNALIGQDIGKKNDKVGSLTVTAFADEDVTVSSKAAAGGILSGQGSIATASVTPDVAATIGSTSAVSVVRDVAVNGTADVTGTATAEGASLGALGVGVSEATASAMPNVTVEIGGSATIGAGNNVTVSGSATNSATTNSIASAGALIGVAGSSSTSTALPSVNAAIGGDSTVDAVNTVGVTSTVTNSAVADASGIILGLAAFGSDTATAVTALPQYGTDGEFSWLGSTAESRIGANAAVTARNVDVSAMSNNLTHADSKAGAGGGIAGVTTKAETVQVNTTIAAIDGSDSNNKKKIGAVEDVTVSADAQTTVDAYADSTSAGLVGVSGGKINNSATSVVEASVGGNNTIEAGSDITVHALNNTQKYNALRPVNLSSGSGGLFGGSAGESFTRISNVTTATLAGNDAKGSGRKISAQGDVTVAAENAVLALDVAMLSAGGLIAVAAVQSTVENYNTATATIGANADVEAGNDLNILAKTSANVQTVTNTNTWGVAAGGHGAAINTVVADNDVRIGMDASLRAGNDIDMYAGMGLLDLQNSLVSRADARSWVSGLIPYSNVTGWAYLWDYNDVDISAGSNVMAGRNINLGAFSGLATVEGYAKAKKKSYALFGIPITIYSNGSRRSYFFDHHVENDASGPSVTIDGTLESGTNRHKTLQIGPDGKVVGGTLKAADYKETTVNLREKVIEKKASLDAKIKELDPNGVYPNLSEKDKVLYDAIKSETVILEGKLKEWQGTPDAELTVPLVVVKDLTTGSGDINVTAVTLKGDGTLKVPGTDFLIRIDNDSLAQLELNKLEILRAASGSVKLNGEVITSHSHGEESLKVVSSGNLGRRIEIFNNAYLDDFPGAITPSDIVLKGDVVNYGGKVTIDNKSGSIAVGGNIIADELDMVMKGGFVREWQPGLYQPGHLIAGNNIYISGEILDINDTIQSGLPYRYLTIPEFDPDKLGPDRVIPTIGDEMSVAKWDPENRRIVVYRMDFGGGKVELYGNVVSTTGKGALKVMDGYGEIAIENLSSKDLVINTLDVGSHVDGQIKIVDTGRKYTDSGVYVGDNNQLVTQVTGNGSKLNVSQGYQLWNQATSKFDYTELDSHGTGSRSAAYSPHSGAQVAAFNDWTLTEKDVQAAWDTWRTTRFTFRNPWLKFALLVDAAIKDALLAKFGQKADYSIGMEFLGNLDEGKISVVNSGTVAPSDIFLNGSVKNSSGNVLIRNDRGSIYSLNDTCAITGRNINLGAAEGNIGSLEQGIKIDTVGGRLDAAAKGLVHIQEIAGDLTIGSVTTQGDVRLVSAGALLDGVGTTPSIVGQNITLMAAGGGIGTADNDLVVNAAGILTAEAKKSIYLTEKEGDAQINRIVSTEGDVVLTVDGALEDHNFNEGLDDDTKEKLLATWDELKLTKQARVDVSIEQYKKQKTTQYQNEHRLSDNGTPFNTNDDTYDAGYDPAWQYTLTAAEIKEFNEGVWTDAELTNAKNINTIAELGKTEILIEEPNISGRNVKIITGAGVGSVMKDEVITAEEIRTGAVTPDQRIAIARAEKDDITIENGNLIVQLKNDVDVQAREMVIIQAKDHVYLGAETDVNIDHVQSANGDIRLKISGNITNGRNDGGVNLTGNDLILEASAGGVGSSGRPLVTDLGNNGVLTARARDDVFLEERSGNLTADSIVSRNGMVELSVANGSATIGNISAPGDIWLKVAGDIANGRFDEGVNLIGDKLIIESSTGSIGTSANPLIVDLTGALTARAGDGIDIRQQAGDMKVDSMYAVHGVRLDAPGSILDANPSGGLNIRAESLSLKAGGSVGGAGAGEALEIGLDPQGMLSAETGGSIFINSPTTSLSTGHISAGGNIVLAGGDDIVVNSAQGGIRTDLGDVAIDAYRSILDGDSDASAGITARNITLAAQTGSIGEGNNPFMIDTLSLGKLDLSASNGVYLTKNMGDMLVRSASSEQGDIALSANDGSMEIENARAAQGSLSAGAQGDMRVVEGTAGRDVTLVAGGEMVLGNVQAAAGNISADSGAALIAETLTAGRDVTLTSPGSMQLGEVRAEGGALDLSSGGVLAMETGYAGTDLHVTSPGEVKLGGLAAAGNITVSAGAELNLARAMAGGDVALTSGAASQLGEVTAENGDVTARAGGNLALTKISAGRNATLEAAGSILNGRGDGASAIDAVSIDLRSEGGSIGTAVAALTIDSSFGDAGTVTASARQDIFLSEVHGDMNLRTVLALEGDLKLTSDGSILPSASENSVNVSARNMALFSTNGSIGTGGRLLVVDSAGDASSPTSPNVSMRAATGIHSVEQAGDLVTSEIVSTGGSIELVVNDGDASIAHISAPDAIDIRVAGGSIHLGTVDPARLDLSASAAGASIDVAEALVSDAVGIRGDHITLGNIRHVDAGRPLHFSIKGGSGEMARTASIGASSPSSIIFDTLTADRFDLSAGVDNLLLQDTLIGSYANIRNNLFSVIVNNVDRQLYSSDAQLYSKNAPFTLQMSAESKLFTDTLVLNYNQAVTVNGYSNDNSMVKVVERNLVATGYAGSMGEAFAPAGKPLPSAGGTVSVHPGILDLPDDDFLMNPDDAEIGAQ
jgi:filamentous hemagglutinin family protein